MDILKTLVLCTGLALTSVASAAPDDPIVTWKRLDTTAAAAAVDADNPDGTPEPCNDGSGGNLFYEYFGNCHANSSRTLLYPLGGAQKGHDGAIRTRMVCDDIHYRTDGFPPYFSGYIVNAWTFGIGVSNPVSAPIGIDLRFYDSDGDHSGPGTPLWGYGFIHNLHAETGDYYGLITLRSPVLSSPILSLHPGSSHDPVIWECLQFQNFGNDLADLDFMNSLSAMEYDGTPEYGSSTDALFLGAPGADVGCAHKPQGAQVSGADGGSFHLHFIFDDPRNLDIDVLWHDSFDHAPGCDYDYRPDGS